MTLIGIDVGGTSIKAVRLSGDGAIEDSREVPKAGNSEEMLGQVASLSASLKSFNTIGIGIGMAGLVRWPEGVFAWGPHVAGEDLAVRSRLEVLTGLPVVADNDANCAALAELTNGAAVGVSNAVVLTLGTGIGAGIIIDGKVYRGRSFAGEAGHMTMVPDGESCECGRRGCWETLVSGTRFTSEAQRIASAHPEGILARLSGRAPDAAHLGPAATQGDLDAEQSIRHAGIWLGRGIANLIVLLDPELIVVGGAAVAVGEMLLVAARQEVSQTIEGSEHRPFVRIEAGQLGPLAGAVGAALLAKAPLKP